MTPFSIMHQATTYPFTSRTHVALAIARGIAAACGHTSLTANHVALGILREGENPAVAALYRGGVDLRALRRDLEAALPARPAVEARPVVKAAHWTILETVRKSIGTPN